MLIGAKDSGIFIFKAETIIRDIFGKILILDTKFLFDHWFIFADQSKIFKGVFDTFDSVSSIW